MTQSQWLGGGSSFGSAGRNSNELILSTNEPKQVRCLIQADEVPFKFFSHVIQADSDKNRGYTEMICVGANAGCPLCAINEATASGAQIANKDRPYPFKVKFAINVWDYSSKSVKILIQGSRLFEDLEKALMARGALMEYDVTLLKSGQGRYGTDYSATPLNNAPFEITDYKSFDLKHEVESMVIDFEKMTAYIKGNTGMDTSNTYSKDTIDSQAKTSTPKKTEVAEEKPAIKETNPVMIEHGKYKGKSVGMVAEKGDKDYLKYLAFGGNKEKPVVKEAAKLVLEGPAAKKPSKQVENEKSDNIDGVEDEVKRLKEYIASAHASDFSTVIEKVEKVCGKVKKLEELTQEEAAEVYKELLPF